MIKKMCLLRIFIFNFRKHSKFQKILKTPESHFGNIFEIFVGPFYGCGGGPHSSPLECTKACCT